MQTIAHDSAFANPITERVGEAMKQAISRDGTAIAYERSGQGPALILVDGALCSRSFGPMPKLAPLLAQHFTVYTYDRRGRGQSGDTQPYSKEREVEDIAALIQEAGGSAFLLGLSSGGGPGAGSRGQRARHQEGGRVRAAVCRRRRSVWRRRTRASAQTAARRGQPRWCGEVLHEIHGRRAGACRRHDAADAVDLAQAGGRRPHAPVRRRCDERIQGSDGTPWRPSRSRRWSCTGPRPMSGCRRPRGPWRRRFPARNTGRLRDRRTT